MGRPSEFTDSQRSSDNGPVRQTRPARSSRNISSLHGGSLCLSQPHALRFTLQVPARQLAPTLELRSGTSVLTTTPRSLLCKAGCHSRAAMPPPTPNAPPPSGAVPCHGTHCKSIFLESVLPDSRSTPCTRGLIRLASRYTPSGCLPFAQQLPYSVAPRRNVTRNQLVAPVGSALPLSAGRAHHRSRQSIAHLLRRHPTPNHQ